MLRTIRNIRKNPPLRACAGIVRIPRAVSKPWVSRVRPRPLPRAHADMSDSQGISGPDRERGRFAVPNPLGWADLSREPQSGRPADPPDGGVKLRPNRFTRRGQRRAGTSSHASGHPDGRASDDGNRLDALRSARPGWSGHPDFFRRERGGQRSRTSTSWRSRRPASIGGGGSPAPSPAPATPDGSTRRSTHPVLLPSSPPGRCRR